MSVSIKDLFGNHWDEFLSDCYGKKALLIKSAYQGTSVGWDDFDAALNNSLYWGHEKIRVVDDEGFFINYNKGDTLQNRIEELDYVRQELGSGRTIILRPFSQWNQFTRSVTKSIEKELNGFSNTYLVASNPKKSSFGIHSDNAHVFVLMGPGKKHWRVYNEFSTFPSFGRNCLLTHDDVTTEIDEILEEGDLLYIPPYKFHEAIAVTPCLLLSFGEEKATVHDFLSMALTYVQKELPIITHQEMPDVITYENYVDNLTGVLENLRIALSQKEFFQKYQSNLNGLRQPPDFDLKNYREHF